MAELDVNTNNSKAELEGIDEEWTPEDEENIRKFMAMSKPPMRAEVLANGGDLHAVEQHIQRCVESGANSVFATPSFIGVVVNNKFMCEKLLKDLNDGGIETAKAQDMPNALMIPSTASYDPKDIMCAVKSLYDNPPDMTVPGLVQIDIKGLMIRPSSILPRGAIYMPSSSFVSRFQRNLADTYAEPNRTENGRQVVVVRGSEDGPCKLTGSYDFMRRTGLKTGAIDFVENTEVTFASKSEAVKALNALGQIAVDMNRHPTTVIEHGEGSSQREVEALIDIKHMERLKDTRGINTLNVVTTTQSPQVASDLQVTFQLTPESGQGCVVVSVAEDKTTGYHLIGNDDLLQRAGFQPSEKDANGNSEVVFKTKRELDNALKKFSQFAGDVMRNQNLQIQYTDNADIGMRESMAKKLAEQGLTGCVIQHEVDGNVSVTIADTKQILDAALQMVEFGEGVTNQSNGEFATFTFQSEEAAQNFMDSLDDAVEEIAMDNVELDPDYDEDDIEFND